MKILFLGSTERGYHCLNALNNRFKNIYLIMEDKQDLKNDETYKYAIDNNIPIYTPKSFKKDEDGYKLLEQLQPDLAILCVYEKIVPKEFIEFFNKKKGCINLHGGRLPKYRGSSVLRWQIRNGETTGAFTILKLEEGVDNGQILGVHEYKIHKNTTINDIILHEHVVFPLLMMQVVGDILHNSLSPKYQPRSNKAHYWHKILEYDREIKFREMTAQQIHNLIRSETKPYPGAFFMIDNTKIRVWDSELIDNETYEGTPGRIVKTIKNNGIIVIAKDKGLLIKNISYDNDNIIIPASEILKTRMQL